MQDKDPKKGKIFDGLKVVEWGNLITAPYCAKLFAHLGAEVIKVEKPGFGASVVSLKQVEVFLSKYLRTFRRSWSIYPENSHMQITPAIYETLN